jgi:DegV family protein with EDD domain
MQILTDRGSDLSEQQLEGLNIQFVPMRLTLDGNTYSSGEDISASEFYDLLSKTDGFPTTSQASVGDFVELFKKMAKVDPEIFYIHISSGLSGSFNSAHTAAEMVPEAKVSFWDTKTLSCPEGWQVEMAVRALQAGWTMAQVQDRLEKIRQGCEGIYTLDTLKYLIHGGRISHMKGLLASVLQIRPIIGVGKEDGKYYTLAQERTTKRALIKLVDLLTRFYPEGTALRVQLLHGKNPDALDVLRDEVARRFECYWTPTMSVAPILGAHTGGSLVGMSIGAMDLFKDVPGIVMSTEIETSLLEKVFS